MGLGRSRWRLRLVAFERCCETDSGECHFEAFHVLQDMLVTLLMYEAGKMKQTDR